MHVSSQPETGVVQPLEDHGFHESLKPFDLNPGQENIEHDSVLLNVGFRSVDEYLQMVKSWWAPAWLSLGTTMTITCRQCG